jgi:hypothetical protein
MKIPWPTRFNGKSRAAREEDDPRWKALMTTGYECSICNQEHRGILNLVFGAPFVWDGPIVHRPNAAIDDALINGTNVLTEDLCVWGDDRFLRCNMRFPIIGTHEVVSFGVWGTVNPARFSELLDQFDDSKACEIGPLFSWLATELPFSGTVLTRSHLVFSAVNEPPELFLDDEEHPYYSKQKNGIRIVELMEIYEYLGHSPVFH